MLNNDFKVLVDKHARYKKQKRKSRYKRIILLILLAGLAYILWNSLSFNPDGKTDTVENNRTTVVKTPSIEENLTETNSSKKIGENSSVLTINERSLKMTTESKSLEQLLANQEKLKSYSATISLANYHYSKKEYQQAIKWSIEASKKNKAKARPWIVYAKSKKALGKPDIAKKALTLFLKNHKSQEAKTLLESL